MNGVATAPIHNWKVSEATPPEAIVTLCPVVPVSADAVPPNQAQFVDPPKPPAVPPPVPQPALHIGVPKLVEVWTVQADHGVPASKVPSTITLAPGGQDGLGVGVLGVTLGVTVGVGVAGVTVGVGVAGVAVGVTVGVGVAGVAVGVTVGVGVAGVTVGVGVGVAGVAVADGVGVGEAQETTGFQMWRA